MALRGIDFHTHPLLVREMIARHPELERAARETFYIGNNFQPLESFLLELDLADLEKAVILPIDATTSRNATVYTNEQIAELCAMSPRLIGFASVDPKQPDAPDKLREAVTKLGLRGLKLAPAMQQFYADDPSVYPIYQTARELGIPILFHAGMSWEPGSRLQFGQPMQFENVVADFPDLQIVLAHLAWPWVTDAVALALKYPNLHLDTSALYFDNPRDFLRYAMTHVVPLTVFERSLRKQILFGSNYPRVEIKNMAAAVRGLGFSDECLDLVFRENADRLLGGRR
ncbi:MAG: amidohydrolase family protein [Bryobacteraceae bacterium]|jgi:predicted TIM-barrel fold metal-dependent hydrolase